MTLALVVQFMEEPIVGVREMERVCADGGTVATCMWNHGGRHGPLSVFWQAVNEESPDAFGESRVIGAREGQLADLLMTSGLREVEETELTVVLEHPTFDDWWEPFTYGVGPAGAYVATLDDKQREHLRMRCRAMLPPEPFVLAVGAWAARGVVSHAA